MPVPFAFQRRWLMILLHYIFSFTSQLPPQSKSKFSHTGPVSIPGKPKTFAVGYLCILLYYPCLKQFQFDSFASMSPGQFHSDHSNFLQGLNLSTFFRNTFLEHVLWKLLDIPSKYNVGKKDVLRKHLYSHLHTAYLTKKEIAHSTLISILLNFSTHFTLFECFELIVLTPTHTQKPIWKCIGGNKIDITWKELKSLC